MTFSTTAWYYIPQSDEIQSYYFVTCTTNKAFITGPQYGRRATNSRKSKSEYSWGWLTLLLWSQMDQAHWMRSQTGLWCTDDTIICAEKWKWMLLRSEDIRSEGIATLLTSTLDLVHWSASHPCRPYPRENRSGSSLMSALYSVPKLVWNL